MIDISSIDEARYRVMHVKPYDSLKWHEKVNRMPDNQVYAIDRKFAEMGLYEPQKAIRNPITGVYERKEYWGLPGYSQISLYELFPEVMNEQKQKSESCIM